MHDLYNSETHVHKWGTNDHFKQTANFTHPVNCDRHSKRCAGTFFLSSCLSCICSYIESSVSWTPWHACTRLVPLARLAHWSCPLYPPNTASLCGKQSCSHNGPGTAHEPGHSPAGMLESAPPQHIPTRVVHLHKTGFIYVVESKKYVKTLEK